MKSKQGSAIKLAKLHYPLADALGSVRQLTDANGAPIMAQSYAPYGDVQESYGLETSNYGFAGEWTDGTGLQYLRARYLNTGIGRFISRDTWAGDYQQPLSLNRWLYGLGNPLRFKDPSGNKYVDCGIGSDCGSQNPVIIESGTVEPDQVISSVGINLMDSCDVVNLGNDSTSNSTSNNSNTNSTNGGGQSYTIWQYGVKLTVAPNAPENRYWTLAEVMNVEDALNALNRFLQASSGKYGSSFTAVFGTNIEIRKTNESGPCFTNPADALNGNLITCGTWVGFIGSALIVHELGHSFDWKKGVSNEFKKYLEEEGKGRGYLTGYNGLGEIARNDIFKSGEDGENTYWFESPADNAFMTPSGIWPDMLVAYVYNWWHVDPRRSSGITIEAEIARGFMVEHFGEYTP